jgi:hypothetical protein
MTPVQEVLLEIYPKYMVTNTRCAAGGSWDLILQYIPLVTGIYRHFKTGTTIMPDFHLTERNKRFNRLP